MSAVAVDHVGAALRQVTEHVLGEMQTGGWFAGTARARSFERPIAWDINSGWCEEWAERAQSAVGGEIVWLDQVGFDPLEFAHAVLDLDGRFYDAQHPDGVDELNALHLVRGTTRSAWLEQTFRVASSGSVAATATVRFGSG